MAEGLGIYKCNVCGNMVEVVRSGEGGLVCCGKPMEYLAAKTADLGKEKHVPVIEKVSGGIKVQVGSIPHPMEEKHYIEWVEVLLGGKACRQFLRPGEAPEAVFHLAGGNVSVREFCNIHGLWEVKQNA